jgi:MtaA/CmuA family methyltransferase
VEFPNDAQPSAKGILVERLEDMDRLHWPKPKDGRLMSDRIHAIRRFKEARPDMVAMGAVEAPFAQACTFLGIERAMTAFFDDPELIRGVMDWIEPRAIQFALAQIEAGADMIFLGDSLASQIGAEFYREFVRDSEIRVVSAIQDRGVPVKLHICGNIRPILGEVAAVGARFVDVDFPVDLSAACAAITTGCPGAYVVGNFHPVQYLLQGTPKDVLRVCAECEAQTKGFNNFILAPGCEVPPHTPPGNYQAMIEFGWKWQENET